MDNKDILKKIKNIDGIGIIFVYIAVFAALSIACPNFLKFSNIMVGIRQAVYTAIVGFAMTFVISMAGCDQAKQCIFSKQCAADSETEFGKYSSGSW